MNSRRKRENKMMVEEELVLLFKKNQFFSNSMTFRERFIYVRINRFIYLFTTQGLNMT